MNAFKVRAPLSSLLAIVCMCAVVLFGMVMPAQAGPLTSANVQIYDGGVLYDNSTLNITMGGTGGSADPWTISLSSKSTTKLVGGAHTDFSFSQTFSTSNQPGDEIAGATITNSNTNVTQTTSGSHTFEVLFSDNGFTLPASKTLTLTSSGGITYTSGTSTSDGSTLQSYADPTNALFGKTVTSGLQTANNSTAKTNNTASYLPDSATSGLFTASTYSLASDAVVSSHEKGAKYQFSSTAIVTTPEPSSVAIFGICLAGMAGYSWRRRQTNRKTLECVSAI